MILGGGMSMINDGADSKINGDIPDIILKSIPDNYTEYNPMFFSKVRPKNYFMLAKPYISGESTDIYKRFDKRYGEYNAVNIDKGFPVIIDSKEIVFPMNAYIISKPKWRFKR